MKKILIPFMASSMALFMIACGNASNHPDDASEMAKESNELKMENDSSGRYMDGASKTADDLVTAASGNLAEVEIAKTYTRSTDADIKKMGKSLVQDHEKLYGEVKGLAEKKGITIPGAADSDAFDKAKDLNETKQDEFDKKWVNTLIDKHEATIKKYEDISARTEDSELKAWVDATLPKVKDHLTMLQGKKDKMK